MKTTMPRIGLAILLGLVLGLVSACSKTRTDAQVASDVQTKIVADQSVPSRQQVGVQAASGVVTLSGSVASDAERNAAASDAAKVEGVKTVVNNLTVQPPAPVQTAQAQPPVQQPAVAPPAPAAPTHERRPRKTRTQARNEQLEQERTVQNSKPSAAIENQPVAPNNSTGTTTSAAALPVVPTTPPPPSRVTIPSGTTISVRLIDSLDSERNHPGDTFRGTLNTPITVNEQVVIPTDADVLGHVVDAQSAGKFSGAGKLAITLDKISYNGHSYQVETNQWSRQSTGRGKNTAEKVGGGAVLGAIIGGLAGGGKGAGIGTIIGGGAGTGVQAATKAQQVKLAPEQLVPFQLQSSITVTPSSGSKRQVLQNE